MTLFYKAVAAVQENNEMNGVSWKDYGHVDDILYMYGLTANLSLIEDQCALLFLDTLIRDNGENVQVYQDAIDCVFYGNTFPF